MSKKQYYDIKVTTMIPATLLYRVYEESPEKAAEIIKYRAPNAIDYKISGKRDIKLLVYEAGCCIIKFFKNYV